MRERNCRNPATVTEVSRQAEGSNIRVAHVQRLPDIVFPRFWNKKITFGITCRAQNPGILRAGRDEVAHGGTAGRGGDGQDRTPTGRFAQETTVLLAFPNIEENCFERFSGSTNKRNPM